ncbi:Succinate dehydrogenase assembly factor 2 mitochondrial [Malassezia caprae]|uniref:Succinate dehydrogenase assembly factor 2 mitochondrial n=1 Tax=Malassezia caprae TaxID=1381934 RepID=A0AAF0EAH2_9BASI|nr:Succinate dehydrogenase assembly factor 2 mitochondrial [Malassezia caprae]
MMLRAAAAGQRHAARARVAVRTLSTSIARASGKGAPRPDLSDPFPLPLSRDMDPARRADGVDLASAGQRIEGIDVPIRVANRENESRPRMLARLQYQCRKRGTLETDLILSTFAQKELARLADEELHELDQLLDEPDWDIFYWCTERKPVPARWEASFSTEGARCGASRP